MGHYLKAEISLAALAHNIREIRARLGKACALCAVVKADAYGHGLAELWEPIAAETDVLAVATAGEAVELRELGYEGPLLTLIAPGAQAGGDGLDAAAELIAHNAAMMITDPADVRPLERLARKMKRRPAVHVKIDTGMGRSGVLPADAPELIASVRDSDKLDLAGVCTHFADCDNPSKAHAAKQFQRFAEATTAAGPLDGVVRHVAASAAVADMPDTRLDMARVGLALYGYQNNDELLTPMDLRPILRLTAPIVQIKRLPMGATCGYGCTCKLIRDSRVGIVPAGYADAIPRVLSNRFGAVVGGALMPVLGRISMDQIIVDLTDAPEIKIGQRIELISPDPDAPCSVANLARVVGTIPYEITSRLGRRIDYVKVKQFPPIEILS